MYVLSFEMCAGPPVLRNDIVCMCYLFKLALMQVQEHNISHKRLHTYIHTYMHAQGETGTHVILRIQYKP